MERIGAVANIQPSFVPTDMHWAFDRLEKSKLEVAIDSMRVACHLDLPYFFH
jgi:hypothetical protein